MNKIKRNRLILIVSVALIAVAELISMRGNGVSDDSAGVASAQEVESHGNGEVKHYRDLLMVVNPVGRTSQVKNYEGFRVSFNKDNGTPNWVSWELLATEADGAFSRSNNFWQDEDIEDCPSSRDYTRSGYDRGHIVPAADQKWSSEAMSDCFTMANICPQAGELNRGAWQTLEKKERLWALRDSALVIVAGPVYSPSDKERIGEAGVRVPSAFFKVIVAPYLDSPRGIGFIYPNRKCPGNMKDYSMPIDEVEKITGYDFFSNLPDEIENIVESSTSFVEWDR